MFRRAYVTVNGVVVSQQEQQGGREEVFFIVTKAKEPTEVDRRSGSVSYGVPMMAHCFD